MNIEGMDTPQAGSGPVVNEVNGITSILMSLFNSYPFAEGPGRAANVTPKQAPK